MVIDVHCHVGLSARRVDPSIPRFLFEPDGAEGSPGYDSFLSPRLLRRPAWFFVKRWMKIDPALPRGEALDQRIEAVNEMHWSNMPSVDRLVLLAFDEYRTDDGHALGAAEKGQRRGSDLYTSNSLVKAMCVARPDRYLFGASIHPYRHGSLEMLAEVAAAGAALIKWLPIHQNIRAEDPRTVAFLREAARLGVPMLIHYGGEMSLSRQHMEFEHPGPMLDTLRALQREEALPCVIVAHAATPSFPWQSSAGFHALMTALLGELSAAPIYADISALAAFGRTDWLSRLATSPQTHRKLVWGSDYPIPVLTGPFWRILDRGTRRRIAAIPSWVEKDLQLKRALGFDDAVFTRAAKLLARH
jgi:predicted TIM-barrel fold metal-dependent hydrolase